MQTSTNVEFGTRVFPVVKLGTHHFPIGTIFRTNVDLCLGHRSNKEYEVRTVVRSDVRSFVLETTTFDPNLDTNVSLNITHVDKIIKRGVGPVLVQDFSFDENEDHIKYVLEKIQRFREFVIAQGVVVRKNEFVFRVFDAVSVVWLYGQEHHDCYQDSNLICNHIKKSSLFKKGQLSLDYCCEEYVIVKKKTFKKWLKQNINRFYISLDKLEKQRDVIDKAMLDQELDMDDDIGCDYGASTNQERIDNLVEEAWAGDVTKELDDALTQVQTEQCSPAVKQENAPLEKKHEEDF